MQDKKMQKNAPNQVKKQLSQALARRALGYELEEVVEEYILDKTDQTTLVLNKKKITKKSVPPDIAAAKTLLSIYQTKKASSLGNLTDEQLKEEKLKLLKQLKQLEEGE